jgi:uncharacterized protein YcfJ
MKLFLFIVLGSIAVSSSANPYFSSDFVSYEYATVLEAEPVVKSVRVVTPVEECWQERVRDHGDDDGVGLVVGAFVGGALGHAVGHHKKNKQVGAVLGSILGATVGNAVSTKKHRRRRHYRTEEFCEIVEQSHFEERIIGYDVRYRYNNSTYNARMDTDPGDTIKVRIKMSPVS